MKTELNPANITLIIVGIVSLSIGLYQTIPLKLDKSFYWQNGPLVLMLCIGLVLFYRRYELGMVETWGKMTITLGGRFLPLMVLLCLIMGIGSVLTKSYRPEIKGFLVNYDNLAPFVGSLTMPTPNTLVPLIENMWDEKKFTPNFLYFLNAASLMSLPLFMLRQVGFRNPEICLKMYIFGCLMAMFTFPFRYRLCWVVDKVYVLL